MNLLNEVCFTIEPHIEGHIESIHVAGPGIRCFLLKDPQGISGHGSSDRGGLANGTRNMMNH